VEAVGERLVVSVVLGVLVDQRAGRVKQLAIVTAPA